MSLRYKRAFVSTLILALIITACSIQRSPVTGDRRAYGFSWEEAKQIGAQADKQVIAQFGIYDNESIQQYVENVAEKVFATSDFSDENVPETYQDAEFTFRVLASPAVNAFALPGGYVYVTRGLLTHLKSEAQLAVVLGHEIGHIAARHASQSAFERQFSQILLIGGAVAGQAILGVPGGRILQLGSLARRFLFLSYSREDERESDALGVEYAAKQGYHAAAGAQFFVSLERLEAASGGIPNWLSSHPDPADRSERIPALAEEWESRGYEQNVRDIDQYMSEIDNIVFGKNPRLGFTRGGNFYHPELEFFFPYPQQWDLVNTPSVVQIINAEGNAIILFQIDSQNSSPRESVYAFLRQDGIEATGASETSNHGLNAFEATATAVTNNGANVSFYIYSVAYNGNIYRFVAYTLSEQFDELRSEFVGTTNNFQTLNDASILNIQPARLNVYRAETTAPFSAFLPENLPLEITAEDVALANQTYLDATVEAGTWVKIPRQ